MRKQKQSRPTSQKGKGTLRANVGTPRPDLHEKPVEVTSEQVLWDRRVLLPILVAIFALSVEGLLTFFQRSDSKEPLLRVVPSIAGAALAVWAAVGAYRSRRIGNRIEPLLATTSAKSFGMGSIEAAAHENESTILLRALEVFGDSERALKWMRENNPALNNDTPILAIQTEEGRREVLNILGRIEYGVIS